ncbi:MAG: hypothetical protein IT443_01765 [Phycisphaeraceae bacterium]|nr:hypothetical protein [Phycisphaeraceae bacterium]
MSSSYSTLVGAVPEPTTFAFRRWYFDLLAARLAECPLERGTTLYVDSSATPGNGDGSLNNPLATLAEAQSQIDAWTPTTAGLRIRFKRGGIYRSATSGLTLNKPGITVDAYGSGAKPLFSRFLVLTSIWQLGAGSRYTQSQFNQVAWLRTIDDPFNPLRRVSSTQEVEATAHSWYLSGSAGSYTLHVNVGGDPQDTLEAAYTNDVDGVLVSADGCRADQLRCDGWGMNPGNAGNQRYGLRVAVKGTDAAVVTGCESYYSSSHALAFYGGGGSGDSGGISLFMDCQAGFTIDNGSGGETIFNSYVYGGDQETIFHGCTARFGTLPVGTADYVRDARAFYGHTNTSVYRLLIAWGCRTADHAFGCGDPGYWSSNPAATRLSEVRGFFVDEMVRISANARARLFMTDNCRINPDWEVTMHGSLSALSEAQIPHSGYLINGRIMVRTTGAAARQGLYNAPAYATVSHPRIYHTHIHVVGNGQYNFTLDYENGGSNPTTSTSPDAELVNSIVSCEGFGPAWMRVGLNNTALNLRHNAYFNLDSATHAVAGYSNDAGKVELDEGTGLGLEPSAVSRLSEAGTSAVRVEYDALWAARDASTPSVGPREMFNVSGDLLSLQAHLDSRLDGLLAQLPGAAASSLLNQTIDGVDLSSLWESILAVMLGVSARSGNTVTFYKRNGTTPKVTVALGNLDGERQTSVIQ